MDLVNVQNEKDFDSISFGRWFTYNCKICGAFCKRKKLRKNQRRLLCTTCSQNDSCIERFGKDNKTILREAKEKFEKSNLEKFGSKQSPEVKEKIRKKCRESLGVDYPFQAQCIQEKVKETLLKRYGVNSYSKTNEFQEKFKKTSIEKFGTEHPCQSKVIKDKIKKTNLQKFGVGCCLLNKEIIKKVESTNLKRYGDIHYINSNACKELCRLRHGSEKPHPYKYKLDGMSFDSFWEVCFYIYFKDHGLFIERTTKPFAYEFGGKTHFYYPDFNISCGIVEIKGDHFFEKDGKMINPFDRSQDAFFEAKHQCGLRNKVMFLLEKDVAFATDYVLLNYGAELKENLH